MRTLDFNCDLGEGCGDDAAILPWISAASIACGGHAGDAASMREAVARCLAQGVAIGAHPSFEDRAHFGRRELPIDAADVAALVRRQTETLADICARQRAPLRHVKPHGALYNLAARDPAIAAAIAQAVRELDPALILYGLAESRLTAAGAAAGLRVAHEVFAERRYEADGTLTPRAQADAVIADLEASLDQVRGLLRSGAVTARTGERVALRADSLCLHGDRADAAAFAQALHAALRAEGVAIAAP